MPNPRLMEVRRVTQAGQITGLKAHAGEEYILVRKPQMPKVISDLASFAREHTKLTRTQYREFTRRHGDPIERARKFSKDLAPEEFREKVKELETTVEKRLGEIAKDLEASYDRLEQEVNETIERLFGGETPATAPNATKAPKNGASAKAEHATKGDKPAA